MNLTEPLQNCTFIALVDLHAVFMLSAATLLLVVTFTSPRLVDNIQCSMDCSMNGFEHCVPHRVIIDALTKTKLMNVLAATAPFKFCTEKIYCMLHFEAPSCKPAASGSLISIKTRPNAST